GRSGAREDDAVEVPDPQAPAADLKLTAGLVLVHRRPRATALLVPLVGGLLAVSFALRTRVAAVLRAASIDQRRLLVREGALAAGVTLPVLFGGGLRPLLLTFHCGVKTLQLLLLHGIELPPGITAKRARRRALCGTGGPGPLDGVAHRAQPRPSPVSVTAAS